MKHFFKSIILSVVSCFLLNSTAYAATYNFQINTTSTISSHIVEVNPCADSLKWYYKIRYEF